MSTHVSIAQAKAEFAALVSRAEAGEEIVLTRNGRPVARLSHLESPPVIYGDLIGLKFSDDLALPAEIIASFEPSR
jgi:antitoxin (DNA-binding transcriptional repressor) of toxin-antitoxin stability system